MVITLAMAASTGLAGITASGDVSPNDPLIWTESTSPYVGYGGVGSVLVDNGSDMLSSTAYMGYLPGSLGTVQVSGDGSSWTHSSNLNVGYSGKAELSITDGASVSNNFGFIGRLFGSTGAATISGPGSIWTNTAQFHVGPNGKGTLNITNAGAIQSSSTWIAAYGSGVGVATISGEGSTWNNEGSIVIGSEGNGTLNIKDQAVVNSDGIIGFTANSLGTVNVSGPGSTWNNPNSLSVGSSGNGTMNILNGGFVNTASSSIGIMADAIGRVTVSGIGSVWTSDRLTFGSRGFGMLNIHYDGHVQVKDSLTMDIFDKTTAFITMGSGGSLTLPGDAEGWLSEFLDSIRGNVDIRYWDESASAWSHITNATPGVDYTLSSFIDTDLIERTTLKVLAPTPLGDTDRNGVVDTDDLANLLAQFGGAPTEYSADFNLDGKVDMADFAILRRHFGVGFIPPPSSPEAPTPTPEPATLTLLAIGGLAILRRRV